MARIQPTIIFDFTDATCRTDINGAHSVVISHIKSLYENGHYFMLILQYNAGHSPSFRPQMAFTIPPDTFSAHQCKPRTHVSESGGAHKLKAES